MAKVGYARVSSVGQNLSVQLSKLKQCDKIFHETKSGTLHKRPQLQACLEYVREGDTLVVTRLDRLARSTLHLCQIAEQIQRKQVNLAVLDQNINTNDATGRLLFNMQKATHAFGLALSAIAQFETEIRAERQMDGIVKAKERGVQKATDDFVLPRFGRKNKLTRQQIVELQQRRKQGTLIKTLIKDYSLSKASVYRYLKESDAD